MARAAGRMAKQWIPSARQSGKFFRHVVPAAFKPLHSLWHEILAFIFLAVAGLVAWKIYRNVETMAPARIITVSIFAVVMAGYGISSYRKSRRITRS